LAKVTGLLRAAERLHTALPAAHKPVWVTELNWESSPQSSRGVIAPLQAPWISRALHRLWAAGVALVDWQFLIDPYQGVLLSDPTGHTVTFQRPAGLFSAGPGGITKAARPKAFLRGFTLPFDPLRVDHGYVRVWALLMHSRQPALLQRQVSHGGGWQTIAHLRANMSGVLNVLVRLTGSRRLRLRSGSLDSAAALVPRRRSSL
jgi:hypothetical protein